MSKEISRATELRQLADLIDAFSLVKTKAQSAGLLIKEGFLTEFKKLEKKIQTELTDKIKDLAK